MKRFVSSIIILCLIVTLSVTSGVFINTEANKIADEIHAALDSPPDDAAGFAEAALSDWETFCSHRLFLVDKENTSAVTAALSRMSASAKYGESNEEFILSAAESLALLQLFISKQKVIWYNIL
ncbi:MAG: hypothetical protein LBN40_01665 [Oscillospiraceae bacterium]|jgi:hypothetical protein|nr:hypothetical protein [Oscillospiraceae bacterium]